MDVKKIIPCLDTREGRTVKGVNFVDIQEVGDPAQMAVKYEREGADELVLLDISATVEGRTTFLDVVRRVAAGISLPFTVGGGIGSVEDAKRVIDAGANKVSVNSAAVARPELIDELSAAFGPNAVTVAIDGRQVDGKWIVTTHGGKRSTDMDLFDWAVEAQKRGAGAILFTSMDHDGTKAGYPLQAYARLSELLAIPVIASGGAGTIDHIADVLTLGKADAALAASVFHYGEIPIPELKQELRRRGIEVKIK